MTEIEKVELKRDIKIILDTYGLAQFNKAVEELEELREAIYMHMAANYGEHTRSHVLEEIADVEIMTAQLKMLFKGDADVDRFKRYKVSRQLKRIEEGTDKCQQE